MRSTAIRAERVVRDPNPDGGWYPVHEWDVADAALAALLEDGHHGKAYDVNGPVDRAAIIRRFNALQPPHQPGYKPIPAMAIGRDENFVRKIAEQVLHEQLRPDLRIVD